MGLGGGVAQHFRSPKGKGGPALGTWGLCGCGLVRSAAATLTEAGLLLQAQPSTPSATSGCCGRFPARPVRAPRVRLAREHCVPLRGRSHKLDSARVQDKQAEAKAVLQRAEQARAEQPENQGLTAADWSDQRDKIMAAQKTIAHYDGTFFAMVQELDRPHQEIHACVSTRLRVRVRPPDCGPAEERDDGLRGV
jgi:hypothetical protein